MVISAMFLAIAVTMRVYFSNYIPIFGESGLRIGLHGMFSAMPAILFGPIYGAIVSGLTDFLGHHIRPSGAFNPLFTLTSILGGFIRGAVWMFLRNRATLTMRNIVIVLSFLIISIGVANTIALNADGVGRDFYDNFASDYADSVDTSEMNLISRMAIVRSIDTQNPANILDDFITFSTVAMIGVGAFGLLLVVLDWAIKRFFLNDHKIATMALLLAMMTAAVLTNTINTYILREMVLPSWQYLPFFAVWFFRVMPTIGTTVINTFFVAFMLGVCNRHSHMRQWLK